MLSAVRQTWLLTTTTIKKKLPAKSSCFNRKHIYKRRKERSLEVFKPQDGALHVCLYVCVVLYDILTNQTVVGLWRRLAVRRRWGCFRHIRATFSSFLKKWSHDHASSVWQPPREMTRRKNSQFQTHSSGVTHRCPFTHSFIKLRKNRKRLISKCAGLLDRSMVSEFLSVFVYREPTIIPCQDHYAAVLL